jgi:Zn-dependent protease with chaperone function/uncharacterized tellurite resistance protein B-like protein
MALDFFSAQDEAKRKSFRLLVLFFVLTIVVSILSSFAAIVAIHPALMFSSARAKFTLNLNMLTYGSIAVFCVISFGAWSMSRRLKKLGVHGMLLKAGAKRTLPNTGDPFEIRFRNVAQEMAIASGMPIPGLYIIPDDPSINAFAAGNSTSDACIVVTSGALQCLSRAELQGVVAHEFSHILNCDMKFNMELISILHGYTLVSSLGRAALRSKKGPRPVGLALFACGLIGLWISTLVKALFSRQREWLADASAVQFTRNPEGLRGALEKIDLNRHGTITKLADSDSFSHMFFTSGVRGFFANILSTHPPVVDRIRALGRPSYQSPNQKIDLEVSPIEDLGALSMGLSNSQINDDKGAPSNLAKAASLIERISKNLREACHTPTKAVAVVIAILIQQGSDRKENVLTLLKRKGSFSIAFMDQVENVILPELASVSLQESMTLLTLACATIRNSAREERKALTRHAFTIITSDKTTTLSEICMFLAICSGILDSNDLRTIGANTKIVPNHDLSLLAAFVAHIGAEGNQTKAQSAFAIVMTELQWTCGVVPSLGEIGADALLRAVGHVRAATVERRKKFIQAIKKGVTSDGKVLETELELLRTICICLECPMPPELIQSQK